MAKQLTNLAIVKIGEPNRRLGFIGGVREVRYQCDNKVLGHIFPTRGEAVIVAMDDWAKAQYCRNMAAAIDWLARNE